jgi:hypothetical protein
MKQSILHSRFKATIPKGAMISMTRNYDKIYYKIKKDKIIISDLNNYNFDKFKTFLKPKIETDGGEWVSLILEVDIKKFDDIVEKSYLLRERKLLCSLLSKCHNEKLYNYFSHLTLNLFEDTMKKNKSNFDDIPWMVSKEFCSFKKLYQYPKNTIKLGNSYVDFGNGIFHNKPNREEVVLSGGILFDKTGCFWMERIKNLIKKTDYSNTVNKMISNSTLIICSQLMVQSWKNILSEILDDVIILTEKRHHSNTTYGNIMKSKAIIISNEFLTNRSYSKSWDDYRIN